MGGGGQLAQPGQMRTQGGDLNNGLAAGAREPGAVNQVDTTPLQAGT